MIFYETIYKISGIIFYSLIFWAVFAAIIRKCCMKSKENIPAKVLYKQTATNTSYDIVQGFMTTKTTYTIAFQTPSGTIVLYSGNGYYNLLEKGDRGRLSYKGNRLICFTLTDREAEKELIDYPN